MGSYYSTQEGKVTGIWVRVFLLVIALLTAFDIAEDFIDGVPLGHLIIEGLIIISSLSLTIYLWRTSLNAIRESRDRLAVELGTAQEELKQWRIKTAKLYSDLHEAMISQFKNWGLSDAESDVAMLLLKGLSHKEIATARTTGEQTVRQQATAIYQKSGLEGRAQLSAFFLEDLLEPDAKTAASNAQ